MTEGFLLLKYELSTRTHLKEVFKGSILLLKYELSSSEFTRKKFVPRLLAVNSFSLNKCYKQETKQFHYIQLMISTHHG